MITCNAYDKIRMYLNFIKDNEEQFNVNAYMRNQ